jgi:hypothetical protein
MYYTNLGFLVLLVSAHLYQISQSHINHLYYIRVLFHITADLNCLIIFEHQPIRSIYYVTFF